MATGNEETITTLNTLIECCKDSEFCFRAGAEHLESADLHPLFVGRAEDCRQAAEELQAQVVALGGEPETGGSAGGALQRGWLAARAGVAGYSELGLLDECARSEDHATVCYRMALEQPLPAAIKELVVRQARDVTLSRNQIMDLHDRLRVQI